MATAVQKKVNVVKAGSIEVGEVNVSKATIKTTGTPTTLPGNIYGDTNFYIQQSRQYFEHLKFRTFIYFPYCHIIYPIIFLGSFLTLLNSIYAFVMTGVNGLFFLMYIQHLYVVITTMRFVLKQPTVPNHTMRLNNDHLEISIDVYRAQYAACDVAGIGIIQQNSGIVKLQVFRSKAFGVMKNVVVITVFSFIGSFLMIFYCLGAGIYRAISPLGGDDQ